MLHWLAITDICSEVIKSYLNYLFSYSSLVVPGLALQHLVFLLPLSTEQLWSCLNPSVMSCIQDELFRKLASQSQKTASVCSHLHNWPASHSRYQHSALIKLHFNFIHLNVTQYHWGLRIQPSSLQAALSA